MLVMTMQEDSSSGERHIYNITLWTHVEINDEL